jgi:hypothetical protein
MGAKWLTDSPEIPTSLNATERAPPPQTRRSLFRTALMYSEYVSVYFFTASIALNHGNAYFYVYYSSCNMYPHSSLNLDQSAFKPFACLHGDLSSCERYVFVGVTH